jgi:hypothetical protein
MMPLPLFGLVDGIQARNRPELDEDIPEMSLDRCLGQMQMRGDLCIAERPRYEFEHFTFTIGQRPWRWSLLDIF